MYIQPVILCGGSGTRLWPLSREQYPKQLLAFDGDRTMLQATALRLSGITLRGGQACLAPIVVANEDYRFITADQFREIGLQPAGIVLEPVGRSTAPALTLAALAAACGDVDPVLLVMPADHVISDTEKFQAAVLCGADIAQAGGLVTFGIAPTSPETGYGYIRRGRALKGASACPAFVLSEFVEKPDMESAEVYVASGKFLWNSGIFMMKASRWIEEISRHRQDIADACNRAYANSAVDKDFRRVGTAEFSACPSDSIDYAVMERVTQVVSEGSVVVVELDAGWSDVGAWDSMWQVGQKDADGNVLRGDVLVLDTKDTFVMADSRLVACVGLDEVVVIETPDAVMVAHKSKTQDVKKIVARLKQDGRPESKAHRKIHRPWGCYDSVDSGDRFQVKRIVVNPGASLSLQLHHHRAEHWIVVRGTARVTRGDEVFLLCENQSTYIPLGVKHRLENPGKLPLEMIEVQSGAYLGEDDILRFEDTYGRS